MVIPATVTTVGTDMDTVDMVDMVTDTGDMAITNRQAWRNAARVATGGDGSPVAVVFMPF
jgi:hypothetical protein